jgi:YidC/Oxa1 family membrane protein insertase
MNPDTRNLIAAIALSMLILIIYQLFLTPPPPAVNGESGLDQTHTGQTLDSFSANNLPATSGAGQITAANTPVATTAPRIDFENSKIAGTISLAKGRIDDLRLLEFGENSADDGQRVHLFRKSGAEDSYFAEIDFLDANNQSLVSADAIWTTDDNVLTPSTPLTLTHDNGEGLNFALTYSMDDQYLITVEAAVTNTSGQSVDIRNMARLLRNKPSLNTFFISYEGPLGVFREGVKENIDYDDIEDLQVSSGITHRSDNVMGWIGITDKYWLSAIIPARQDDVSFTFRRAGGAGIRTQIDTITDPHTLDNGATMTRSFNLFAGPKQTPTLDYYNQTHGIERLDHAIDWGWFPFLTKPFYFAINWLFGLLGNFGLAILAVTVVVKLAFFPLANKSYKSMAKMRELAPKVQELRSRFADDKPRQQQEMMQLYRTEKVNPAAGCLPVLLQIPVFFALYKVLFINIDMRHAPFYGWITDLSAIDPTSVLNLFGLLPYSTDIFPDFLNLGVWPILMGITMFVQMSLNPPPPDPVQAKVFKFMPVFFTFLLATFPAGLVIYWTWNNLLSIIQQWYIMQSMKKSESASIDT